MARTPRVGPVALPLPLPLPPQECLEMRNIGSSVEGLPRGVEQIPGPRLQRQVGVHCPWATGGVPLRVSLKYRHCVAEALSFPCALHPNHGQTGRPALECLCNSMT